MKGYAMHSLTGTIVLLLLLLTPVTEAQSSGRCYRGNQDMVFLVDSSGSITLPNWEILTQFTFDLIDALEVGINKTRVGVTVFSNSATNAFYLNTYETKAEILAHIPTLPYISSGTNTPLGIRVVREQQFAEEHGDRADAQDAIILLTDAQTTRSGLEEELALTQAAGIRMFAVGIGNIDEDLLAIQGYSGYWTSTDFEALESIRANLTSIRCLGEIDKNDCVASCKEDQEGCYRDGSIQICKCSYDWVSKYCFPNFPQLPGDGGDGGGGGAGGGGGDGNPGGGDGETPGGDRGGVMEDLCITFPFDQSTGVPFPRISMVCPTYGPEAGGTDLFIWGEYFTVPGSGPSGNEAVTVGNSDCRILQINSTFIHCLTSACNVTTRGNVASDVSVITNGTAVAKNAFTCKSNPVIDDLYPLRQFLAGGNDLTVDGSNLQSVSRPILEVTMVYNTVNATTNTLFTSLCVPESTTKMTCPYPKIELPEGYSIKPGSSRRKRSSDTRERREIHKTVRAIREGGQREKRQAEGVAVNKTNVLEFYLGFKLDGVTTYTNVSKVLGSKGMLFVYKDPDIRLFQEKDGIKAYEDDSNLRIEGDNLDFGCYPNCGYVVNVGAGVCDILDLTMNELRCQPPSEEPETTEKYKNAVPVTVVVGNLRFLPGHLRYPPPPKDPPRENPSRADSQQMDWRTVLIYLGCAIIVAIVLLMFLFMCCYDEYRHREVVHHVRKTEKRIWSNRRVDPLVPYREQLDDASMATLITPLVKDGKNVRIGTTIKKGSIGVVYAAWLFENNDISIHVTAKTLIGERPKIAALNRFLEDSLVLHSVNHKNLLPFYGIIFKHNGLYVLTGRGEYGTLKNFVTLRRQITRSHKLKMCLDVAQGMEYLADHRIVHKDLAARNCVVDEQYDVMITDRGLAADMNPDDYFFLGHKRQSVAVRWAALEVLNSGKYSTMSDVWSFGVLMWEVFSQGKLPYTDVSIYKVRHHLNHNIRLERPVGTSLECYTAMEACWNPLPHNRPSFEKLSIIINTMYMKCEGRTRTTRVDENVYITRANAYSPAGIGSYKPAAQAVAPTPAAHHGTGRYNDRGTYLIEVESDFDWSEDPEQATVQDDDHDDKEPPMYATVNKNAPPPPPPPQAADPENGYVERDSDALGEDPGYAAVQQDAGEAPLAGEYLDMGPGSGSSVGSVRKPAYDNEGFDY